MDDMRNGLFLHGCIHLTWFNFIAFLKTPNFAMDTADVDPAAPDARAPRYSAHIFVPERNEFFGDYRLRTGHPLHIAAADWPPDVLLDYSYGAAVLHKFGVAAPADGGFATAWNSRYYTPGARLRSRYAHVSDASDGGSSSASGVMRLDWRDPFDRLLMLPYLMMPPQDARALLAAQNEKRAADRRAALEDKVGAWRGGVVDGAEAVEGGV